ncbi:MAG TPA: ABC transporter ATP-binding protein [Thermodesulfovibrionales bacterium]|nr:ABC transporter ATP-binding protein [Thermodesulfovibrionales bacterium]
MSFLQVDNISKRFGGLQAVKDVSFGVERGMIKAVIGPNGAGKTTLFNLISGFLTPDGGAITFVGKATHGLPPYQIAALGLSRTFQHIKIFPRMTVIENVMVGRHVRSHAGFVAGMLNLPRTWLEEKEMRVWALGVMEFLGIASFAEMEAASLSYGQQRIVELARALSGEPTMLLLDEPAAGLNMRETKNIATLISKIRDKGVTVLIVEHDMSLVMNISDEVLVLSYGEKIADATPGSVQKNPDVIRVYLGEDDA